MCNVLIMNVFDKSETYFHDFCIRMTAFDLSMMAFIENQKCNHLHLDETMR